MVSTTSPLPPAYLLQAAQANDLDHLVEVRIAAMRESLERLGRFDPQRARERFASGFDAACTQHIEVAGERVGFVVVKPQEGGWLLDHLYILPQAQGQRLGATVLRDLLAQADAAGAAVRVGALAQSASNRFYERHGFVLVEQTALDNYYVRQANLPT